MKNSKISVPVIISSIILVVFLVFSFFVCNTSETVAIQGVYGSYAETYANDKNIEFIPCEEYTLNLTSPDSAETSTESAQQSDGENTEFSYNNVNGSIEVTAYKGTASVATVPSSIDGVAVTAISMKVLDHGLSSVKIPSSVTSINTSFKSARYSTAFFVSLIIIVLAYAFSILATVIGAKKMDNNEGTFYGIPFVYGGMVSFIILCAWNAVSMYFNLSIALNVIVSVVILAFAAAALVFRSAARDGIMGREKEVREKTAYIKLLAVDAQTLVASAPSEESKKSATRIYEAVRYSDPMSVEALSGVESQIAIKFNDFITAINDDDSAMYLTLEKELKVLLESRNNKCKLLK